MTMANGEAAWDPKTWEKALGSRIEDYYAPEQQFQQFATTLRPSWQYRAPLSDLEQRLQARYSLQAPMAGGQTSFRNYLGQYGPGGYGQDADMLRARAMTARDIAQYTPVELEAKYAPGSADFNQAAWYRMMYGQPTGESLANQRALVNLLALQRPTAAGGGEYRGRMATAIQNMLSELYQARAGAGQPGSTFLDWYLQQTAPPTTNTGAGQEG